LATMTNLIMTANLRQLRHMIKLRTHKSAQWEIRDLFEEILGIMAEQAPNVFSDLYD
jgi:thymidylate synthase (FAD)